MLVIPWSSSLVRCRTTGGQTSPPPHRLEAGISRTRATVKRQSWRTSTSLLNKASWRFLTLDKHMLQTWKETNKLMRYLLGSERQLLDCTGKEDATLHELAWHHRWRWTWRLEGLANYGSRRDSFWLLSGETLLFFYNTLNALACFSFAICSDRLSFPYCARKYLKLSPCGSCLGVKS